MARISIPRAVLFVKVPKFQPTHLRSFHTTTPRLAKNRVFDPVRTPSELDTLLLIHTSRPAPLLVLFTASWCRSCLHIEPIIRGLIEDEYVGLEQGGVGFVEVRLDSPLIEDVGDRYAIKSVPTLLAFSRGEAQMETRETDTRRLEDREWLGRWIENEARRGGKGGAGGAGWFGGFFGS